MTEFRARAIRDGLSVAGLVCLAWFVFTWPAWGFDAHYYWAVDPTNPYTITSDPSLPDAFRYTPVAAQALGFVNWLSWPHFGVLWYAMLAASVVWLARRWALAVLVFLPITYSIWLGNLDILYAVAIVAGFRHPATWSFVLLTKLSPGVGLLWFAVRGEWRHLGLAVGLPLVLAGISFFITPNLWIEWIVSLRAVDDSVFQPLPLWLRITGAAAIVVWGGRTNRPWTVVAAAAIAAPWFSSRVLAVLVGIVPLMRIDAMERLGLSAGIGEARVAGGSMLRSTFT